MKIRFWAVLFFLLCVFCIWSAFGKTSAIGRGGVDELSDDLTAAIRQSGRARAVFGLNESDETYFL